MNAITSMMKGIPRTSVVPVQAVMAGQLAHEEPKTREENGDRGGREGDVLGSYRSTLPAITACTKQGVVTSNTAPWPTGLPRLVLDIETYYDRAYSLEKLDTVAYTYDGRFHLHGIAVRYPDGRAEFRTDVQTLLVELRHAYGTELERAAVVFHNGYFDYFVLHHRLGLAIRHIADTMLLSRLLHGADEEHTLEALAHRYGLPAKGDLNFMEGVREPNPEQLERLRAYAVNDVEITAQLADRLVPLAAQRPVELWTAEHSVRMFVERPLAVNASLVQSAQATLEAAIAAKVVASGLDEKTIRSTKGFPTALEAALARTGRTLPTKPGKNGSIPAIAKNDPARADLLADPDPVVRALMEAKAAVGSAADSRGRLVRLATMATLTRSRGYFLHSYHRAGPGRFAGGDGFNIQNLKRADTGAVDADVATAIRRSIGALPGMMLGAADASQIEARVLAWLAGQQDLHDAFAGGRDIYSEFASLQLHREVRKPRKDDTPEKATELRVLRQIGKQAILGLGYGMGVGGFIKNLRSKPALADLFATGMLSDTVCAAIVYGYKDQYPRIVRFWDAAEDAVRRAMLGIPTEISGMLFRREGGTLLIGLRSGRDLVYPQIRETPPTYETFSYLDRDGVRQTAVKDRPSILYGNGFGIYGGLICENIVQGTARDLLVDVLFRLEAAGLTVIHHCHDSITVTVPAAQLDAAKQQLIDAWRTVPPWAAGLVLDAEAKGGATLEAV